MGWLGFVSQAAGFIFAFVGLIILFKYSEKKEDNKDNANISPTENQLKQSPKIPNAN